MQQSTDPDLSVASRYDKKPGAITASGFSIFIADLMRQARGLANTLPLSPSVSVAVVRCLAVRALGAMHELHGVEVPVFDCSQFDFDLTLIPFGRLSLTHAHADFHLAA